MRLNHRSLVPASVAALTLLFSAALCGVTWGQSGKAAPPPPPRVGEAQPKPRTKGAIRIASYNIENLFDNKDDPALSDKYDDLKSAKPEAHKQAVAETIRRIDADILALEEIESLEALIEFRDQYLKGAGYEHVVSIDAGDERGIENSVLSRFPITESINWVGKKLEAEHPEKTGNRPNEWFGKPVTFHRSPLRVTVRIPEEKTGSGKPYELTLFVVHAKSGGFFDYWREAESRGTLELIGEFTKEKPEANVFVLGDFNAQTHDTSIGMYLKAGFKELYYDRPLDGTEFLTHASDRAIDIILYNAAAAGEVIKTSRFVLGTPQLDQNADWRTAPKPAGYASDHCPIVVDLRPSDN